MPLVFAYGSNMDAAAMARRCPRARLVGLARLARHRLAVMREGWLTVVRDPHSSAHGVLWDLALSDVAGLDRYDLELPVDDELRRRLAEFGDAPGERGA